MPHYAIGDVQGCRQALERLLDRIRFDPAADHIWFAGDLVNRGPDSAGTLRLIRSLGATATTVLGNHDLHLLAVAAGAPPGKHDTLLDVLRASDREELLDWLLQRPLLHHAPELGWTLVHAGLPPQWDLPTAEACAREVETVLRGPESGTFLRRMYGNEPSQWRPDLSQTERLRFTVNCLTRLRYCAPDGRLLLKHKGAPGSQPTGALPWFQVPGRRTMGQRIVFGHWAALGRIHWPEATVWGIDTGCVWGNRLSALCLETRVIVQCDCEPRQKIRKPAEGEPIESTVPR